MKNTAVFAAVLLLGVSVATAGLEHQDPAYAAVYQASREDVVQLTTDTESQAWDNHVRYTDRYDHAAEARGSCLPDPRRQAGLPTGELDWGPDILLRSGSNFPGDVGRLSIDHAENGDLYAAVLNLTGAPQDTIHTFFSTNGGNTWAPWTPVVNTASDDTLIDAKIIVGPGADPWIYTFAHYTTSGGALYCRKMKHDGSGLVWTDIISGDSIRGFDVDRNIEGSMAMFLTYRQDPGNNFNWLRLYASYDNGASWTNGRSVAHGNRSERPSVCAGGDGYVYLTWCDDSTVPWVGRYTNNLVSPSYNFANPDSVAGDFTYMQTVCASRTAPGASQSAWVLNRHRHTNGNYDIHVSYTTDGGASWTTDPWPPTNNSRDDWNMRWPALRYAYDYSVELCAASATLACVGAGFDSVIHSFSFSATPDSWESREIINDHSSTRAFASAIDIANSTGGSAICYRQYGSPNVWFDYWWNLTGMAQEKPVPVTSSVPAVDVSPSPVTGRALVRYSLAAPGRAELAVFDVTGRRLEVLASGLMAAGDHTATWNSTTAAPGVYLVKLTADGRTCSERVVVAR